MRRTTITEIQALIEQSKSITTSGHPFLDQRWLNEGLDKRNHCYRRQYYRTNQLLVKTLEPEVVVELGIDEGDSVGHFAQGCASTMVYGIDVHKDWEYPSQRCREVEKIFPNFKYLRGWTWERLKDIKALGKPVDFLFIDSWHEPDYLIRDWNDYCDCLHKDSLVIVDDLNDGRLQDIFYKMPGEHHLDLALGNGMGFLVCDESYSNGKLPFKKQDYMP